MRLTGFLELLAGVLVLGSEPPIPQCPVSGCGPPFNYGLYNTVGWVLIVIGLVQIAASFFIGRNRKSKPDVLANTGAIEDQTPPKSSFSLKEAQKGWWGRPDLNRRITGIAAPMGNHPRKRVIKLFVV